MAPGEKVRGVRIPESLWRDAQAVATARGENLSTVIREALRRYVTRHAPKP